MKEGHKEYRRKEKARKLKHIEYESIKNPFNQLNLPQYEPTSLFRKMNNDKKKVLKDDSSWIMPIFWRFELESRDQMTGRQGYCYNQRPGIEVDSA
jgi:hypothetical protein